jgi:predicted  nucleic acid-binding Zn-ribbon protein
MKKITFSFMLFDEANNKIKKLPLIIQLFEPNEKVWVTITKADLLNSDFFLELIIDGRTKLHSILKNYFEANINMDIRVLSEKNFYNLSKPCIIAYSNSFEKNEKEEYIKCDLGSFYLLNENLAKLNNKHTDFTYISLPFNYLDSAIETKNVEEDIKAKEKGLRMLNTIELELDKQQKEVGKLKNDKLQLEQELLKINIENQKANNKIVEIETAKEILILDLNKVIQSKIDVINDVNNELKLAKKNTENINKENIVLTENIASLEKQLSDLRSDVKINERPIAVKNFYNNIVKEIETADLASTQSGYKLSNISLKLKTIIGQDENQQVSLQFLKADKLKDFKGDMLSEMTFDINPTGQNSNSDIAKMPNLIGFTETAVRKIIQSNNLKLNAVYQKNTQVAYGESFKQTPLPGTSFESNIVVTVIFSKYE